MGRRKDNSMFIYPEEYGRLKRGPQVVLPKDIGIIIAYSGVDKNCVCVDAGTGSGWLALALAKICKHVYSYDTREEFSGIAEKNRRMLNLDNITFKTGDVCKGISERNVDLVTLDMPSSEKAVRAAAKALREGGTIVGYLPHTEQVRKFADKLGKAGFSGIYTIECIVRDILVRESGTRPSTKGVWHTAYLTFGRKSANKTQ